MKKLISAILVMLLVCCAAFAQEMEVPADFEGIFLNENEEMSLDLDQDGRNERILVKKEGVYEEEYVILYVFSADGGVHRLDTGLVYTTDMLVDDLNQDGKKEILISGDVYSDDYCTWCLNYNEETGLTPVAFEDAARGENTGEYYDQGYGKIISMNGNELTLLGSQDVLGTWMSTRVYKFEDDRFSLADDGLWHMAEITVENGMWDYFHLTLTRDLPVKLEDGSEATLKAGDAFVVTASDKVSIVYFETADGVKGSFAIEPDLDYGWGSKINGESEDLWFEYLPYAD